MSAHAFQIRTLITLSGIAVNAQGVGSPSAVEKYDISDWRAGDELSHGGDPILGRTGGHGRQRVRPGTRQHEPFNLTRELLDGDMGMFGKLARWANLARVSYTEYMLDEFGQAIGVLYGPIGGLMTNVSRGDRDADSSDHLTMTIGIKLDGLGLPNPANLNAANSLTREPIGTTL